MANKRREPVTEDATWGGYLPPPHIKAYVHARDGYACRYCGASGEGVVLEADHVLPTRLGGDNVCSNLVTACLPCNRSKGGHTVACWQAGRPCRSRPRLYSYQYPQCAMEESTMNDTPPANELTTYQRLAAPFELGEHARVNKGGFDQTYAPWTSYVERMTAVLGGNWSNRIVREGFTDTECWALCEVRALIDGQWVIHQQYGSEPITKGRDAKPTTDLLKSVASDALKKAISLFGPGLYLSIKEEREAIDQAMREAVRAEAARMRGEQPEDDREAPPAGRQGQGAAPAQLRRPAAPETPPEPLTASERTGLEHRYESLREHAIKLGSRTSWIGKGSEAWTDAQLPKYIGLLENLVKRQQGAA